MRYALFADAVEYMKLYSNLRSSHKNGTGYDNRIELPFSVDGPIEICKHCQRSSFWHLTHLRHLYP
jgi:hypothetical protein